MKSDNHKTKNDNQKGRKKEIHRVEDIHSTYVSDKGLIFWIYKELTLINRKWAKRHFPKEDM